MNSDKHLSIQNTVIGLLLLILLPLMGVVESGGSLAPYLHFPPLTREIVQSEFYWPIWACLALALTAICAPFIRAIWRYRSPGSEHVAPRQPFPRWGWIGVIGTILAWILAWNRFPWFAPWQAHTFSPLWIGYIVVVNAWTYQRSNTCLLLDRPRFLLLLTVSSAAFWWFFEYLNRFVQNWYYLGISNFSTWEYFWFATLPFATVLPAVVSTAELLASYSFINVFAHFRALPHLEPRRVAPIVFIVSCIGLGSIRVWPELLFPLLWIAPLAILTSLDAMIGLPTIFSPLRNGDWRRIVQYALAALICGLFWEMWNYRSLAQWKYTVPFVQAFHLFEMPLLGYAGYLPFGMECAIIADRVAWWMEVQPTPSHRYRLASLWRRSPILAHIFLIGSVLYLMFHEGIEIAMFWTLFWVVIIGFMATPFIALVFCVKAVLTFRRRRIGTPWKARLMWQIIGMAIFTLMAWELFTFELRYTD